jgi:hypothetical protein
MVFVSFDGGEHATGGLREQGIYSYFVHMSSQRVQHSILAKCHAMAVRRIVSVDPTILQN